MKIISLNIWRYDGNWQKRKPKIIEFIKKENPDAIFLQEVFDDSRHNKLGNNQALQLNSELKFKTLIYNIAEKLKTEHKQKINVLVFDGLACLTNHKILNKGIIKLKKQFDDKHYRIIQKVKININGKNIIFYHTHFSNRDDWAIIHLRETIKKAEKEKKLPIIIGDLNMINTKDLTNNSKSKYKNSYEFKKYYSFPQKKETLDYILIPKNNFKFIKVKCSTKGMSDHKALIGVIEKK
ncbi:MAG: endonuclease/exonuclease/phosphatase family protein [Nanoarchaeota archaeon]|nr:endonuclease/exonuclease/phosphatase family protein [Nanoarchaeota archaeon]MBU0962443.1 endonuclease/exonuclease/phosphatase family protein [Nanoarchaeota archaeon]